MTPTIALSLDGYTDLPPGKIANVVTFFELTEPPTAAPIVRPGLTVRHIRAPATAWYRALYRRIGENWLWFSRADMSNAELTAIILRSTTAVLALEEAGAAIGLAEIDLSGAGNAEIVTFGVVPEATGRGVARVLMGHTLDFAFANGAGRVWLHTCTFDHPAAVRFYNGCGFRAYKFAIEVSDDPRATGALPVTAGPHVPFIKAR